MISSARRDALPERCYRRYPREMARTTAAGLVAFFLIVACNQAPPPVVVSVPNVVGQPVTQSQAELKALGLASTVEVKGGCPGCPMAISQAHRPVAAVIDQSPAPGIKLSKGGVVKLGVQCTC